MSAHSCCIVGHFVWENSLFNICSFPNAIFSCEDVLKSRTGMMYNLIWNVLEMFVNLTLIQNLFFILIWDVYQMSSTGGRCQKPCTVLTPSFFPLFLAFVYKAAFLYCLNLMRLWLVKPQGGAKDHKRALGGLSVSNLIFSVVVFVLCVCPGLCKYIFIYILHVQCAAVCLHRSACAFIWAFFLRFYVVPHHTHTFTHFTRAHTLELRHNSHTHTPFPTSMCVSSLFFATDILSCFFAVTESQWSDKEHWE